MAERAARRVAMVSGAGRGVGAEIARRLLDEDWIVSVGVRSVDAVAKIYADVPGGRVSVHHFDADLPQTAGT